MAVLIAGVGEAAPIPRAAEPVVTIDEPSGTLSVDTARLEHWRAIAAKSAGGTRGRALDRQVLEFLVSSGWIEGEARERGASVSDRAVGTEFAREKASAFRNEAAYRRFLKRTGYAEADLRFRIRVQMDSGRLRKKVLATVAVSEEQVTAYLARHPPRTPERRSVQLLAAPTRAAALQALADIRAGASFAAAARRWSAKASERLAAPRSAVPAPLRARAFAARPRALIGPIAAGRRFYVLRVVAIHHPHALPAARAREAVRRHLRAAAEARTLDAFVADFQRHWLARTTCAPAYMWFQDCANYDGTPVPD